jgi:hypothetical protein
MRLLVWLAIALGVFCAAVLLVEARAAGERSDDPFSVRALFRSVPVRSSARWRLVMEAVMVLAASGVFYWAFL